ncbi:glutamate racemase [Bacteroides sp. CAG:545]|nr:glutamate racemase [Bacteroides sp. CAG:545]
MIKIGVFDSGEGGLSVLKEITRLLPEAEYVYYSDNAHCPYGEKSPEYIQDRARAITERLLKEGADVIVVACNTATAAAISVLRAEYSDASSQEVRDKVRELTGGRHDHICFIGMEPAVKPAALGTRTGVVGVLATAGTLKGSKYLKTKESVDDQVNVFEHVGRGFVELVEEGRLSGSEAEDVVKASLGPLLSAGADIIVLGCTHYPFLLPVLQKVAGPDIRFIDPAPAVARQLVHVLERDGMLSAGEASSALARNASAVPSSPHVKLLSSGDPEPLHHLYGTIFTNS